MDRGRGRRDKRGEEGERQSKKINKEREVEEEEAIGEHEKEAAWKGEREKWDEGRLEVVGRK